MPRRERQQLVQDAFEDDGVSDAKRSRPFSVRASLILLVDTELGLNDAIAEFIAFLVIFRCAGGLVIAMFLPRPVAPMSARQQSLPRTEAGRLRQLAPSNFRAAR